MATYIAIIDYTDQGIRGIRDSPGRAEAFEARAKEVGVEVRRIYWTFGGHDGVLILEAPDDESVSALMLWLGSLGNVRTKTLRAYDRDEMKRILDRAG